MVLVGVPGSVVMVKVLVGAVPVTVEVATAIPVGVTVAGGAGAAGVVKFFEHPVIAPRRSKTKKAANRKTGFDFMAFSP